MLSRGNSNNNNNKKKQFLKCSKINEQISKITLNKWYTGRVLYSWPVE